MSELFTSLGLNAKMLIAQMINFAILLYVLHRFVYKPILRMLTDRTERIEQGLAQAEAAQKKMSEVAEREKDILTKAKREARDIVATANKQAQEHRAQLIAAAQEETARMIAETQAQMERQKAQLMEEVQKDVAVLVVDAVERVVGERLDSAMDQKIIAEALTRK